MGQISLLFYIKGNIERNMDNIVDKNIREHNLDEASHVNLLRLKQLEERQLNTFNRQLDVLQKLSAIQAIQQEQEQRLNRIQAKQK